MRPSVPSVPLIPTHLASAPRNHIRKRPSSLMIRRREATDPWPSSDCMASDTVTSGRSCQAAGKIRLIVSYVSRRYSFLELQVHACATELLRRQRVNVSRLATTTGYYNTLSHSLSLSLYARAHSHTKTLAHSHTHMCTHGHTHVHIHTHTVRACGPVSVKGGAGNSERRGGTRMGFFFRAHGYHLELQLK